MSCLGFKPPHLHMFAAIHIPTGLVVDVIDGPWYDFDKSKPRDFSAFPKYGWDILGADYG